MLYSATMKTFTITKEEAVALYRTQTALARALGIHRSAVNKWKDGEPIPEAQALKIRYVLRPECFDATA